jgi:hypothetical protein
LPPRILATLLLMTTVQGLPVPPRTADSSSALVVGQVVDAESGRPISGAVVVLAGPSPAGGGPHPRILTGSDGRFVYRDLRRGAYRVSANRPGFVEGAYGRMRPGGPARPLSLADGERTADAVVRLWRQAAISGAVVDEAGEHLIGVRVQAYRRTIVSGRQRFVAAGTGLTDDRGIYRVSGLIPGDYIVGAASRHAAVPLAETGRRPAAGLAPDERDGAAAMIQIRDAGYVIGGGTPAPPPSKGGRMAIYPPTFHPDAHAADAALVIGLGPGMEFSSADIQLRPTPVVSVSGHVVGPDGPVTMTALRLVAAQAAEVAVGGDGTTTRTDRAGRFTFPVVPQGHYTLELRRGAASGPRGGVPAVALIWAEVPVSVGLSDVEHLVVEAQPGLVIGGRVEFEAHGNVSPPPLTSVGLAIEAADPDSMIMGAGELPTRADVAGDFRSVPVPGGRYYVRVPNSPSGWMFKSATSAGRDVADTPMTVLTDTLDVVVTFTNRWSGVHGFVQNAQGPDPSAAVLVFPTDSNTWESSGAHPRRVRMVRPGRTGDYSLNLPPGEYYVIAVPDAQAAGWGDRDFLGRVSRDAVRIDIAEGERISQDLRTRDLR